MSDALSIVLALEARDRATQIFEKMVATLKNVEGAVKTAAGMSTRSGAEIEAAQVRAAAATSSYERAVRAQAVAQKDLQAALELSKEATVQGAAATKIAAEQEEAALVRLQEAERLVATRSSEMAAAQEAASTRSKLGATALKGVAIAGAAAAVGVAVVGEKSIKAAADYESATTRLVTSANEQKSNIDAVRQGMLQMAGQVGYSTEALAAAMYKVESGGQHGAAGLQVLRAAAEGAKAENADLTTVADAVTSAMQDYHLKAEDAATVTSKLVAATASGKMTFEELSGSLSAILPIASASHVSLNDVLGDLASMTVHGMSAQQASQNLADAIRKMSTAASSNAQSHELALIGIDARNLANDLGTKGLSGTLQEVSQAIQQHMGAGSTQVILNMMTALKGLPPAVQDLGQKVIDGSISMKDFTAQAKSMGVIADKQVTAFATLAGSTHQIGQAQVSGAQVMQNYTQALRAATGDATATNVALMLTGENSNTTATAIKNVSGATTEAGNHVKGWSEIQNTFNQRMSALKGHLEGAKIAIGTGLLPVVSSLADKVMKVVTPVTDWMTKHEKLTGIILGSIGALGGLVATGVVLAKTIEMVKTAMVALRIATIAEDEALTANPIGIVVALLVALGVAIYEAYKHSETFRKIVQGAWNGIKTAAMAAWNDVLKPTFEAIKTAIMQGVVPAALWLWHNVIEPVWQGIQVAISVAWAVIKVIWDLIQADIKVLAAVFTWLWKNVLEPVWDGIRLAIEVAWAAIQIVWGLIRIEIKILADVFTWLWRNVLEPVWHGISDAIRWAWDNVIRPYWNLIKAEIHVLADVFTWFWHNVLEPVWHGISTAISWAWDNVIKPVFNAVGGFIKDTVVPAFKSGVDSIGKAWDALRDLAKKPVAFVVNSVINPLISGYDDIAKVFGVNQVKTISGFATGGQIPGAPSATDNMLAMVATGEFIMPTDKTARYLPLLEAMRSGALPGFAGGGLVGMITNPVGWAKGLVGSGIDNLLNRFGHTTFAQMLAGMGHHLVDGLVSKAKSLLGSLGGGGGGGGQLDQWIATALAATGSPMSWLGPMHTLVMRESGGRTDAVNRSDINWLNGTPSVGLAQVIGPTFAAYAGAFRNVGPFLYGVSTDPIANLVASLSYIRSVYGSIFNVQQAVGATPKGYALGGLVRTGVFDSGGPLYPGLTLAYNGTGRTEYVSTGEPAGGTVNYVNIDLRDSKVMSDRDMDVLLGKIDKRLVQVLLPGAGVQVRR